MKWPVLDITGSFFRMSTQVKAELRSTKAVTWLRMRKKKPIIYGQILFIGQRSFDCRLYLYISYFKVFQVNRIVYI
jgi:hypothetical protein